MNTSNERDESKLNRRDGSSMVEEDEDDDIDEICCVKEWRGLDELDEDSPP